MTEPIFEGPCVTAMLEGLYEVTDRGDGYAEIALKGHFGEITESDIAAQAAWDTHVGRPHLPLPAGRVITRLIVGGVHGDEGRVQAAQDAVTGEWVRAESAFPGYAHLANRSERVRVATLPDLEQFLRENHAVTLSQSSIVRTAPMVSTDQPSSQEPQACPGGQS